jgi:branched-chain amino acid aminotransferase
MTAVFLNGQFVEPDHARVSAFDAGFQHGVGLFETMLGRVEEGGGGRGEIVRLDEHLDRLIASARELGLGVLRHAPLAEAVLRTLEHAALARARIRLTVSGGDLNLLGRPGAGAPSAPSAPSAPPGPKGIDPTILIVAQPATVYPPEMLERGVMVSIAELRINPLDALAGHKTLNYWGRLRELQAAAAKKAGEAIVLQVTNHLAGGCVSNLFLVKGGELLTPIARGEEAEVASVAAEGEDHGQAQGGQPAPRGIAPGALPSPVLPGITRGWVLEWAAERKIAAQRRMLTVDDLLGADEAFLTNSSWGVLPVVQVEQARIGGGEAGELTRAAQQAWQREITPG